MCPMMGILTSQLVSGLFAHFIFGIDIFENLGEIQYNFIFPNILLFALIFHQSSS